MGLQDKQKRLVSGLTMLLDDFISSASPSAGLFPTPEHKHGEAIRK